MFNKMNGITLFPSNDDLVQYYEMRKFKTISTNTYIFGVDEFQNSTNVFKHTLKTQDMSFKEKINFIQWYDYHICQFRNEGWHS